MATLGRSPGHRPAPPTAQDLDVEIDELSLDGDGVAHHGRLTIYVPFTIPGERVRVRVGHADRGRASGTLLEVLQASPHRVVPRCAHFGPPGQKTRPDHGGGCGGCSWQHIAYPEQLRLKTSLVDRLVRAEVPDAPRVAPMLAPDPDEPWGFRQKVHFVFGEGAGRRGSRDLLMGHYARNSRRVVNVTECPVHDPRGNALAFAVHRQLARARIQADARQGAALQSIAVRAALSSDELMATLVVSHETDRQLRTATRKAMDTAPARASFHLNVHDRDDGYIFGARTRTLKGAERLREDVHGASYLISPTAFFQTNVRAAALLVSQVLAAMPSTPARVLDLYAGGGLFAIPIARAGHTVTAVESNRQAVADGIASARLNRLTDHQCRFVVSRTENAVLSASRVDVVVLDPPREGCAPGVVDMVFGRLTPPLAVYVSCNPEALASDLGAIVRHGYRLRSLVPVDMFPHTAHIETVAVLAR